MRCRAISDTRRRRGAAGGCGFATSGAGPAKGSVAEIKKIPRAERQQIQIENVLSKYYPDVAPVLAATDLTPFAMTSPSQFRPKPPIALESEQWAKDYNEIKELGAKNSSKRSARQTEDARFWLLTGQLSHARGDGKCFFAFANTVATRRFGSPQAGRGWVGIRFQARPHEQPSQITLHAH